MAIITSTVKVGQRPPKEVIKRVKKAVREARKHPEVYDPDCPPSTPEALKEFAHLAAERNRRKKKRSVTIRIAPDVLESYKTMGDGYTGIMADVLKYAIDNPGVLTAATR
ncbi:BrnA antitoxin family protein [Treponema sp. TIM-1]|uniref:BrnA antitoxin family protein n=1 Tax=Treponema sp. TIM-1 TaxID=2898417 RepID=UPI00398106C9